MALYIQKFGGSSLATTDLIYRVASRIKRFREQGHQLVIVVSAMQGDTDHLLSLAQSHFKSGMAHRELACLLSTGEQKCAALLSMALHSFGFAAQSLNAYQAGIFVEGSPLSAEITRIETDRIQSLLTVGAIPVITGFQGIDSCSDQNTMGRGGSDLTAVALAHWLEADECQIYTDVDGVYTVDPNVVSSARVVSRLSYAEMLELSKHGAKVLQYRAVQLAARYAVPVRVMHAHGDDALSTIVQSLAVNELPYITGIGLDRNQVKITISGPKSDSHLMRELAETLRYADFMIDMYMQHEYDAVIDIKFTTHWEQFDSAWTCVNHFIADKPGLTASYSRNCAKVSLIGFGMSRQAHLSALVLQLLTDQQIEIGLLSSFCYRLSLLVAADSLEQVAKILHHRLIEMPHMEMFR